MHSQSHPIALVGVSLFRSRQRPKPLRRHRARPVPATGDRRLRSCTVRVNERARRSADGIAHGAAHRRESRFSRTVPHKVGGACPSRGDAKTPEAAYPVNMSNPWSSLVETLSGTERKTPHTWPARRVHRIMDDGAPSKLLAREARPSVRGDRRPSLAQASVPVMRSRCPCTECQVGPAEVTRPA